MLICKGNSDCPSFIFSTRKSWLKGHCSHTSLPTHGGCTVSFDSTSIRPTIDRGSTRGSTPDASLTRGSASPFNMCSCRAAHRGDRSRNTDTFPTIHTECRAPCAMAWKSGRSDTGALAPPNAVPPVTCEYDLTGETIKMSQPRGPIPRAWMGDRTRRERRGNWSAKSVWARLLINSHCAGVRATMTTSCKSGATRPSSCLCTRAPSALGRTFRSIRSTRKASPRLKGPPSADVSSQQDRPMTREWSRKCHGPNNPLPIPCHGASNIDFRTSF
mmetsp:Transcript_54261/g.106167  ORF Transcript_54261/g.106167 Transcript_54261/m.106167 type:complete len:273 (+) Transcript_54261:144-962(+)